MVSGSERKALEQIHESGGESSSHKVSRQLGIDTGYARLLCMNLARKDYVDLKRSGRFVITFKGKRALGKTSSVEAKETGRQVPFKRQSQERLGWDLLSNVRGDGYRTAPAFSKPGQDELAWTTAKVDHSGTRFSEGGRECGLESYLRKQPIPVVFAKEAEKNQRVPYAPYAGDRGRSP